MPSRSTPVLYLCVLAFFSVAGCRDKSRTPGAGAAASASASAAGSAHLTSGPAPAAPPADVTPLPPRSDDPGPGAKLEPSPLGPADAIEPPTRAVVPGMTMKQALAAGAKGKAPWLEVTPSITAWVQNKTNRVERLS